MAPRIFSDSRLTDASLVLKRRISGTLRIGVSQHSRALTSSCNFALSLSLPLSRLPFGVIVLLRLFLASFVFCKYFISPLRAPTLIFRPLGLFSVCARALFVSFPLTAAFEFSLQYAPLAAHGLR